MKAGSGKKRSNALTERHNQYRRLSGNEPSAWSIYGLQPDTKFTYLNFELGLGEAGPNDNGNNGTNELYECGMKASKMMKDFFVSIINDVLSAIRHVKTCAFIISGLHMLVSIMDSPKGSVRRITRSERALFPGEPKLCVSRLVPILELTYRVRLYMLDTVNSIANNGQIVSLGKQSKKRLLIPQCIVTPGTFSLSSSSTSSTSNTTDTNKSNKRQK